MDTRYTLQDWNNGSLIRLASQEEITKGLQESIFTINKNTSYSDLFLVDGKEVCLFIEKLPDSKFVVEYHYDDGDLGAYPLNLIEQWDVLEHLKDALAKGQIPGSEYHHLEKIIIRLADENGD